MSSPPSAPAPLAPTSVTSPASQPQRSVSKYSVATVTRVVGYGLVVMFLFDLPAVLIAYAQNPLDPQMDGVLVSQILERIAVPLIAFAFIFGFETHDLRRVERIARKLLSHLMLIGSIGCLGLSALAVSSAIRQYSRAATAVDFRTNQRVSALTQLGTQVGALNGNSLSAAYSGIVHPDASRPLPPPAQMRREITTSLPAAIETLYSTARTAKSQGRRTEFVSMIKYAIDGLVAAILFFVLWEGSYAARTFRIFRQRGGPSLSVEGAVIGGIASVGRKMETIRILPNFEDYSWYRRIRRKLRHRRDKKDR